MTTRKVTEGGCLAELSLPGHNSGFEKKKSPPPSSEACPSEYESVHVCPLLGY